MFDEPASDPAQVGRDIADFDIGEPLGTVAERLREDAHGVHWWGGLNAELPTLPDSKRLRSVLAQARAKHVQRSLGDQDPTAT